MNHAAQSKSGLNISANPWSDKPIHDQRSLKVICVGAGPSGLLLAYKLQRSFEDFDLVLYEKNEDIGGTWLENKYPGCACDIPGHVYTWSFEPNPTCSTTYIGTDEVQDYFVRFADKYGLRAYCKFKKEISRAEWDNDKGQWEVEVVDLETGATFHDWCHFLINASGILNSWKWPDVPGIDKFEGKIVHTANYDRSLDLTDKTVALVGNGSSGIQVLPAILPQVKKVITFNRSPTWVLPTNLTQQHDYSNEEKHAFASDPEKLREHRRELDSTFAAIYPVFLRDTPMQRAMTASTREIMSEKLKESGLEDKVIPTWALGCRRLTPGVGYLEALVDKKTEVVMGGVKEITARTCIGEDGKEHNVDVIICATGFDTSFKPRFPVLGLDGASLADIWREEPKSYMGFASPGIPNYFMVLGPCSPIGPTSVLFTIEAQIDHMLKLINRYQTENIKSISPKFEAVKDLTAFKDAYMKRTVWDLECRSWYKNGSASGKVTALWPGSALHYLETVSEPRYEDWDFTYVGGNRFAYLGNGFSQTEVDRTADWSWYLKAEDDSPLLGRAKYRKAVTKSGTISRPN